MSAPDVLTILTAAFATHTPGPALAPSRPRRFTPLTPGTVVNGRYTIESLVGRGGMGSVYAATDVLHPARRLALKVIHGMAEDPARTSLFEAEFRIMARLEHPNIARVYDFEHIRGTGDCLIAMELINRPPGVSANVRAPSWQGAVDEVVQVCRALSYVHSRGIVHFDLKPANILVNEEGVAKVVDFGIARDSSRLDDHMMGTLVYMAPEVFGGTRQADHRADLYSLGITFYELLVGRPPYSGRTLPDVVNWMLGGTVEFPEKCAIPAWLQTVVRTLCAREPWERYRSADAVIEAVNAGGGLDYEVETVSTRQSYILTPRFAGRTGEHDRIVHFASRRLDRKGGPPLLLVSGPPGIGKSRLMREVRHRMQLRRQVFIKVNCYEGGAAEYGPWADLLGQLVSVVEELGGEAIVRQALPELGRIAPALLQSRTVAPASSTGSAEDERIRMLEASSRFIVQASGIVPFSIYLNDLHWAGRGTAQAFAHLAERVRDDEADGEPVALALLGSFRDEEVSGRPFGESLARLEAQRAVEAVELAALDEEAVRDVIQSMLGVDRIPQEFVTRVTCETSGNPFFIQELMRTLVDDGTVYLDHGRWAMSGTIGAIRIPTAIADVFRRRYALLSGDAQEVVSILSVHARPLALELLGGVLGSREDAATRLRVLVEKGLVVRVDARARTYALEHDRMRETVYADLPESERRTLHCRLATLLDRAGPEAERDDATLDQIAYHYRHAGVTDRALAAAIPAGERAMARFANSTALQHFAYALEVLSAEDPRRPTILEHHADMLARLLRYDEALAEYHVLRRRFESRPLDRARIDGKLADICQQRSELEQAVEHGWSALEAYGERRPRGRAAWTLATAAGFLRAVLDRLRLPMPARTPAHLELRVAVYDRLVRTYFFLSPRSAFHCALRLWWLATRSRDGEVRACGQANLGLILGIAGLRRWAFDLFDQALHAAETAGSKRWLGSTGMMRGVVARMEGRWEPERLERAVEALRDAGDGFELSAAVYHACDVSYYRGEITQAFERARAYNAASLRVSQGVSASMRGTLNVEAICRVLRQDGSGYAQFQANLESARRNRDRLVANTTLHRWGESLVKDGRPAEGLAMLEESYAGWTRLRLVDNYTSEVLYKLPRAYLGMATLDASQARRLAAAHREAMRKTRRVHASWRSPTLVNEALRLERAGQHERADHFFAQAIEVARRQDAGLFVADGLYEWGAACARRGDAAGAAGRLGEALTIAEAGGNLLLAERCRRARAGAATPAL